MSIVSSLIVGAGSASGERGCGLVGVDVVALMASAAADAGTAPSAASSVSAASTT